MRSSVVFSAPFQIDVVKEPCPEPEASQLLVETRYSAISAGTEMLFYRGQAPAEGGMDSTIAALTGEVQYPLRYGYAAVGEVIEVGSEVNSDWIGELVFAFHPHTSHFVVDVADCKPIPPAVELAQAVLLPNMETAVNLIMDGLPLLGERVVVFGQGIVGLLAAHLLAKHPLQQLVTVDRYAQRRQLSMELGVTHSGDPLDDTFSQTLTEFDLAYELSGHPATLNQAIKATGFAGRVVIGSWYGEKEAPIDLGGYFHRSRIRLISSQVSTLSPSHHGRWDKERRIATAWSHLAAGQELARCVTHQIPIEDAADAYRLVDQTPESVVQVLFTY